MNEVRPRNFSSYISIPVVIDYFKTFFRYFLISSRFWDEVIVRSDGTRATMREFVKEMLYYNPHFHITLSRDGRTWYLKRREDA